MCGVGYFKLWLSRLECLVLCVCGSMCLCVSLYDTMCWERMRLCSYMYFCNKVCENVMLCVHIIKLSQYKCVSEVVFEFVWILKKCVRFIITQFQLSIISLVMELLHECQWWFLWYHETKWLDWHSALWTVTHTILSQTYTHMYASTPTLSDAIILSPHINMKAYLVLLRSCQH